MLPPLDPDDEEDVANREKPFEAWTDEDMFKAFTLPPIGKKAHIHSMDDQSKFNGMIVTLETWDNTNQYVEARLDNTQALIKVGIGNQNLRKIQEMKL